MMFDKYYGWWSKKRCRIDGGPPKQEGINRSNILRTSRNYLGEHAWVETHLGGTCDILLEEIKVQWDSGYEKAAL